MKNTIFKIGLLVASFNAYSVGGTQFNFCGSNQWALDRFYQQIARSSNPDEAQEVFKKNIKELCYEVTDEEMNGAIKLGQEAVLQRKRVLINELLIEAKRISQYRMAPELMNRIEELRTELGLEWSQITSQQSLATLMTDAAQNQEQRKQSCTTIDLKENYPFLENNRHQGSPDTAWCFAYTASDMLSAYYQKHNPGSEHRFSAVGMAIDYYFNDNFSQDVERLMNSSRRFDGVRASSARAGISEAIFSNTLHRRGICSESDVHGSPDISGHIRAIEQIEDLRKTLFGSNDLDDDQVESLSSQISECTQYTGALNTIFPNMPWDSFTEILRKAEDQNYMTRLVNLNCQDRRVSPGMPVQDQLRSNYNFRTARQNIDEALEGASPLFLAYHSQVIRHGSDLTPEHYRFGNDRHASLIIGRRFDEKTNSCQYQIRNSYGSSCEGYHPSLECEHGQFWLTEETLEKAFVKTLWFEEE